MCHYTDTTTPIEQQVLELVQNTTGALVDTWEGDVDLVTLSASVGNNDVAPDYYVANVTSSAAPQANSYFHSLEDILEPNLETFPNVSSDKFDAVSGVEVQITENITGLLINTLIYSPSLASSNETSNFTENFDAGSDPQGQFAWLEQRLAAVRAEGDTAYIIGHIPPVFDQYNFANEWKEEYASKYAQIIGKVGSIMNLELDVR